MDHLTHTSIDILIHIIQISLMETLLKGLLPKMEKESGIKLVNMLYLMQEYIKTEIFLKDTKIDKVVRFLLIHLI